MPPSSHDRLSSGITARYQHREHRHHRDRCREPRRTANQRGTPRSRSSSIVLITTHAASAASAIATHVRYSSDGQKLALKKPVPHARRARSPGVSCQLRMPLMKNRLSHAATAYSASSRSRARSDEPVTDLVERVAGDDLDGEAHPLGRPQPVELVEHEADRARADLDRREPDRDAGQRAEHEADEHEHLEVAVDEARARRARLPRCASRSKYHSSMPPPIANCARNTWTMPTPPITMPFISGPKSLTG